MSYTATLTPVSKTESLIQHHDEMEEIRASGCFPEFRFQLQQ